MGIILVDLKADEIEKVVEKRAIFKFDASIFGFQFLKVFVIDLEKKGFCSRWSWTISAENIMDIIYNIYILYKNTIRRTLMDDENSRWNRMDAAPLIKK